MSGALHAVPQVESCLALMSMAGLERFATKQTLMVRGLMGVWGNGWRSPCENLQSERLPL